jgi:hypothetical protein
MSEQPERCEIQIIPDPIKVWKLKFTGECSETLKLIEALPARKRRYLKSRIELEG